MPIVNWLVDNAADGLGIECRRQGCGVRMIGDGPVPAMFPEGSCVIARVPLGFAGYIKRECRWTPGVYLDAEAYRCINYYPVLQDYLLAQTHVIAPFRELSRIKEAAYDILFEDGCTFIRPDSGLKPFAGQLLEDEDFEEQLDELVCYDLHPDALCVLSPPRNIDHEWRFVAVDDQIIAGSQYRRDGRVKHVLEWPPGALDVAEKVAKLYRPDRAFTIDICQTKAGGFYLLEINSFCCAGLYACDMEPIVRELSRVALEDWRRSR